MRIRDSSDLHYDVQPDHERAFVERLDPAEVEGGAWRANLVGGRRRSDG